MGAIGPGVWPRRGDPLALKVQGVPQASCRPPAHGRLCRQVSGVWHSISMASDDMTRIEENGDLRVFIQKIESLDNGGLKLSFHFM